MNPVSSGYAFDPLQGLVVVQAEVFGRLGRDVPWSIIEAATGIDEAAFDRLKYQLDAADGGATH